MKKSFYSVSGQPLTLEIINHDKGQFREFVLAAPHFNFRKWLSLTLFLSCLSLACEVYIEDLWLLGAIFCLLCFALLIKLHRKIKMESVLVIPAVGLQHTTQYASGRRQTHFISQLHWKATVINEGITMQRVLFYLAIVLSSGSEQMKKGDADKSLEHEDDAEIAPASCCDSKKADCLGHETRILQTDSVYPLFLNLWPRLDVIRIVYAGILSTSIASDS